MPPSQKSSPKIYQILIRTHKTTLFLTMPPSTSLSALKEQTLSALNSGLGEEEIPAVESAEDFELCRCRVVKPRDQNAATVPQRKYDVLDEMESTIKDLGLINWEVLYVQFKDGKERPLEIVATDPPIDDDEDEEPQHKVPAVNKKGKRKANEDDDEEFL
ncbi:hypothetical protein EV361DRAFT_896470 [Lentinula raphanica]|uniref:Uncharacterized protein n=1 Tax=Lentinula raphanica TaxID=153919 RepID=A0AA38P920_9AGAR|nr:hypothetical protein FB446DRAFT_717856 [Lentinula raphanica]KAJ3838554.1 hypothetical protein F5878DRAFT_619205 [Lentinula raphanica]KAJ3974073.1 hypothetical protein EV361DRAFT_896470 [Lentinula raphanica]